MSEQKKGFFYLGKSDDKSFMYSADELTTHAVCVGMTGSGKTGLGIAFLEEAAIEGIPAIIIDPKGDLADLMLAFPNLSLEEFEPWVDAREAQRKGLDVKAYAQEVADTWKEGLKKWDEDIERVSVYKNALERIIYTPGSEAGVPIAVLNTFAAPNTNLIEDSEALRDRVISSVSGLLTLLGIQADPLQSKEHILISTILADAWRKGNDLSLVDLIKNIQNPPFDKIGVFSVDDFYSNKERLALAMQLNNLIASPSFQVWRKGESLDIQRFLYDDNGKPRHAIISIAHLSDSERMFFVTILLNELLAWVRKQSGVSNLRAIFYMDEIFGFFPPSANPPSKLPMLTLLKQARAFGLGIFLSTQNPMDLDYKALSNCGTWFIGKLQTQRDRDRVMEGLSSSIKNEAQKEKIRMLLADCGSRKFIMQNIHQPEALFFETRWTLSYLRGPLTLSQIAQLMKPFVKKYPEQEDVKIDATISENIKEYAIKNPSVLNVKGPYWVAMTKLHFVDTKNKIDKWEKRIFAIPLNTEEMSWDNAIEIKEDVMPVAPLTTHREDIPSRLLTEKSIKEQQKKIAAFVYETQRLIIYNFSEFNLSSDGNESESEFIERMKKEHGDLLDLAQSEEVKKIQDKINKIESKLSSHEDKVWKNRWDMALSVGKIFLNGIFTKKGGMKSTAINQAGSAIKKATQMSGDIKDQQELESALKVYQEQLNALEKQNDNQFTPEKIAIAPKRTDILIESIGILWPN